MKSIIKKIGEIFPIKFQPEHNFRYVYKDGKRLGPFIYSTEWTKIENLENQLIGDKRKYWEAQIERHAFNKSYEHPTNPVHFTRNVILHLKRVIYEKDDQNKIKNEKLKEMGIELNRLRKLLAEIEGSELKPTLDLSKEKIKSLETRTELEKIELFMSTFGYDRAKQLEILDMYKYFLIEYDTYTDMM